ncbi:hypothetical protein ACFX5K_01250 [Rickettsiales bacterium LUAb2]
MLPLEMKEPIKSGTMKAFVSKNIEVNVGDKFCFLEGFQWNKELKEHRPALLVGLNDDYVEVLAKAECVGVVKFNSITNYYDNWSFSIMRDSFRGYHTNTVRLNTEDFGFGNEDKRLKVYINSTFDKDYPEHATGYLHLFELVKEQQ